MRICSRTSTRKTLSLSARQPDELLQGETVLIGRVTCSKEFFIINMVFNKMEETFQSNTLDWSSLVYFYFISFPPSAFCDFSAIFHRIVLIFGQLIDNNL